MRPLLLMAATLALLLPAADADWSTHRGNVSRTGAADDQPGPIKPQVLWLHKSQEHFVASPSVGADALYVAGLGAFNTSSLHAFNLDSQPGKQIRWSKTTPYLKLPVVCSAVLAEGQLVFGDGMHQTDGAILHGLDAASGLPLWQLTVPGKLVHLEGAPAIAQGHIVIGGGNAGVLCIDPSQLSLEGRPINLTEARSLLKKKWEELQAKYEVEKKRDPDFAVPPSEDQLPRPTPKVLWRAGGERWHVDAPVAIAGDRILTASAYLDTEKVGHRALLCLDAATGDQKWEFPLRHNPWSGATIAGDLALVGCSSIRFEPKTIPGAKGEVVAIEIGNGKERWRQEVKGGVPSAVAVRNGLALAATTGGQVVAFDAATGEKKWTYNGGQPFFAGVAAASNAVYVADLKGIVHGIDLAKGTKLWTLDLGRAPVNTPGMVYGSPVLSKGRLYVATCNLEGDNQRKPTIVVCLGDK